MGSLIFLKTQKYKTVATSYYNDGEKMKTVTDFTLGGSKITANGDCSHKIKRHLLLGGKGLALAI